MRNALEQALPIAHGDQQALTGWAQQADGLPQSNISSELQLCGSVYFFGLTYPSNVQSFGASKKRKKT